MLKINKKSDYGLVLLSFLKNKDSFVPLSQFIELTGLPQRFVARIASDLTKHGILKSKEGKVGGYALARKMSKISLYEYFSIFDRFSLLQCCRGDYQCPYESLCLHKPFFKKTLSTQFSDVLKSYTLADLFTN